MAKVVKQPVEVFPPSDRELALRAQIRTGWSTISSHDTHYVGVNSSELKQIQQVLERAQAMERMEEIRIGLQMLKHKEMVEKCHGDGITTCRICNRNFSNKRSHTPEPIYYCADCQLIVCHRCKIEADKSILCSICHEERELWKKSGSWLENNYSTPTISIPLEDLEDIQQQIAAKNKRLTARNKETASRDFVSPYQLEDEDDDDDSLSDSQRLSFGDASSIGDRNSPTVLNRLEQFKQPKFPDLDSSTGSIDVDDMKSRSHGDLTTEMEEIRHRSRTGSGLSRRSAITKINRDRLLSSRDRARSNRSHPGSRVPAPSESASSSVPGPSSASPDMYEEVLSGSVSRSASIPGIKIRKPSTQTPPQNQSLKSIPPRMPPVSTSPDDSEPESGKSYVIRQADNSADSPDIILVDGEEPVDVEQSVSPLMLAKHRAGSNPSSPEYVQRYETSHEPPKPVPRPRKNVMEEPVKKQSEQQNTFADEFRKVTSPVHDEFKKTSTSPVVSSAPADDLFKKVGSPPRKPPAVLSTAEKKLSSPSKEESDLFKKVGSPPSKPPAVLSTAEKKLSSPSKEESDLFKKVGSPPSKPPAILSTPEKKLSSPSKEESDLFKKVGSPPSKPPAVWRQNIETRTSPVREVSVDAAFERADKPPSKVVYPPPTAFSDDDDAGEFKKVSVREEVKVETVVPVMSAPLSSLPTHSPPVKPAVPTRRRVLPNAPQDGPGTKKMGEIGKQPSNVSVDSSVMSEISTTMETDHSAMDSPTSVTSSGSGDSQHKYPSGPGSSDHHHQSPSVAEPSSSLLTSEQTSPHVTRGFSRRNAQRITRNKRPSPQPRSADDSQAHSDGGAEKESQPEDLDDASPRFRARSGLVTRPAGGFKRHRGRGGEGSEVSSGGSPSLKPALEEEGAEERGRSRGSSLNHQDRGLARKARLATAAASKRDAGHEHTPSYKTDGEFGSIRMTLGYEESKSELAVTVHSCKGLRAMDKSGLSDPYVKVFLQPRNKLEKFRTKTIFKNLNPSFQESFTFTGLTTEALEKRKLCAVVMDYDELSKDDLIGGTQINLYEVLEASTREICIKRLLDDRSVPKEVIVKDRGSVNLYIQYSVEMKALVVSVISAKNLPTHGQCEVYVKCNWTSRSHTIKAKTKHSAKTTDPHFNEDLIMKATLRDLTYSKLLVTVWEHRSFKDKLLGEIHFSTVAFWKSFVSDPGRVVQDWYPLEAPSLHSTGNSTNSLPRHLL